MSLRRRGCAILRDYDSSSEEVRDTQGVKVAMPSSHSQLLSIASRRLGKFVTSVYLADGKLVQTQELRALKPDSTLFCFTQAGRPSDPPPGGAAVQVPKRNSIDDHSRSHTRSPLYPRTSVRPVATRPSKDRTADPLAGGRRPSTVHSLANRPPRSSSTPRRIETRASSPALPSERPTRFIPSLHATQSARLTTTRRVSTVRRARVDVQGEAEKRASLQTPKRASNRVDLNSRRSSAPLNSTNPRLARLWERPSGKRAASVERTRVAVSARPTASTTHTTQTGVSVKSPPTTLPELSASEESGGGGDSPASTPSVSPTASASPSPASRSPPVAAPIHQSPTQPSPTSPPITAPARTYSPPHARAHTRPASSPPQVRMPSGAPMRPVSRPSPPPQMCAVPSSPPQAHMRHIASPAPSPPPPSPPIQEERPNSPPSPVGLAAFYGTPATGTGSKQPAAISLEGVVELSDDESERPSDDECLEDLLPSRLQQQKDHKAKPYVEEIDDEEEYRTPSSLAGQAAFGAAAPSGARSDDDIDGMDDVGRDNDLAESDDSDAPRASSPLPGLAAFYSAPVGKTEQGPAIVELSSDESERDDDDGDDDDEDDDDVEDLIGQLERQPNEPDQPPAEYFAQPQPNGPLPSVDPAPISWDVGGIDDIDDEPLRPDPSAPPKPPPSNDFIAMPAAFRDSLPEGVAANLPDEPFTATSAAFPIPSDVPFPMSSPDTQPHNPTGMGSGFSMSHEPPMPGGAAPDPAGGHPVGAPPGFPGFFDMPQSEGSTEHGGPAGGAATMKQEEAVFHLQNWFASAFGKGVIQWGPASEMYEEPAEWVDLKKQIDDLEVTQTTLEAEKNRQANRIQELTSDLAASKEQLSEQRDECETLRRDHTQVFDALRREREEGQARSRRLQDELSVQGERIAALSTDLAATNGRLQAAESMGERYKSELQVAKSELRELKKAGAVTAGRIGGANGASTDKAEEQRRRDELYQQERLKWAAKRRPTAAAAATTVVNTSVA